MFSTYLEVDMLKISNDSVAWILRKTVSHILYKNRTMLINTNDIVVTHCIFENRFDFMSYENLNI